MAAKFHVIRGGLWDRRFRELSPHSKVVALYIMTAPTRVSEGLFELSKGHIVVDTNLQAVTVEKAFLELSEAGLVDYDEDAEVVLDRLALKTNPLRNPREKDGSPKLNDDGEPKIDKRIPNAVKLFGQVPDSRLKAEFVILADRYSPDLADAIRTDSPRIYPRTLEAPWEDLGRTIEGPSRVESEKRRARDEAEPESEASSLTGAQRSDFEW